MAKRKSDVDLDEDRYDEIVNEGQEKAKEDIKQTLHVLRQVPRGTPLLAKGGRPLALLSVVSAEPHLPYLTVVDFDATRFLSKNHLFAAASARFLPQVSVSVTDGVAEVYWCLTGGPPGSILFITSATIRETIQEHSNDKQTVAYLKTEEGANRFVQGIDINLWAIIRAYVCQA